MSSSSQFIESKIAGLEEQLYRITILKRELEAYRDRWTAGPVDDPCNQELCSLIEEVAGYSLPNH